MTSLVDWSSVVGATAHAVAVGFEIAGIATILIVSVAATARLWGDLRKLADWTAALPPFRNTIGRGVLLGLELLVAADIIGTIAITPTFRSLGILAVIIAIRTFLSASLSVEIEGKWPWRREQN